MISHIFFVSFPGLISELIWFIRWTTMGHINMDTFENVDHDALHFAVPAALLRHLEKKTGDDKR